MQNYQLSPLPITNYPLPTYSDSPMRVKAAQLRGEEYFAFVVSMAFLNAVALSSFCSLFL